MAYGFKHMYNVLEMLYAPVQRTLTFDVPSDDGRKKIANGWRGAWRIVAAIDIQGQLNDRSGTSFLLNGSDFAAIQSRLGAQVRCENIAKILNQVSEDRGWCVRLSCDHKEEKGWEIAGTLQHVYARYVIPPALEIIESMKFASAPGDNF